MADSFFIVWSPSGSTPPTIQHTTKKSASKEARRLAKENPSETFFACQAVYGATVFLDEVDMQHNEGIEDDDIPF